MKCSETVAYYLLMPTNPLSVTCLWRASRHFKAWCKWVMVNPSVCLKEGKNRSNGAGSVIAVQEHHLSLPLAFSLNELECLRPAPPLLAISLALTRSEHWPFLAFLWHDVVAEAFPDCESNSSSIAQVIFFVSLEPVLNVAACCQQPIDQISNVGLASDNHKNLSFFAPVYVGL